VESAWVTGSVMTNPESEPVRRCKVSIFLFPISSGSRRRRTKLRLTVSETAQREKEAQKW